jgi:hypothetical protein
MKNSKFLILAVMLTSMKALAGGFTPSLPDSTVTCKGDRGQIVFEVFKSNYKGQMLNLLETNSGARISITDEDFIAQLKRENLLVISKWDQREFIKSIGGNPEDYKHHVIGFFGAQTRDKNFLSSVLMGGDLDHAYGSALHIHNSLTEVPRTDTTHPLRYYTEFSVEQQSKTNYLVSVNKIEAGQKLCLETELVPNPWAGLNQDLPKMMVVCKRYQDITNQSRVLVAQIQLQIESCRLNKPLK